MDALRVRAHPQIPRGRCDSKAPRALGLDLGARRQPRCEALALEPGVV